jgi:hypothetical protein
MNILINFRKIISAVFCAVLFLGAIPAGNAQADKHPRVAELEDRIRTFSNDFIKARFPQVPFLISVNVLPLHRVTKSNSDEDDGLPFVDFSQEEIQDEWDDPAVNWQTLIVRSNRITIELSLSDDVLDSDAGEAKETLFKSLHLVPGRDEIRVSLRKWVQSNATANKFDPILIGSGLILVLALIFGLFLVQWKADRVRKKLAEQTVKKPAADTEKDATPAITMPAFSSSHPLPREDRRLPASNAGFNAFDAQAWIQNTVRTIVSSPSFPTLEHLTELEKFGELHPEGLGAVLEEFPEAERKRLFTLGASSVWVVALSHPGEIGAEEVSLLRRLGRISGSRPRLTEDVLISLWRLKEELPSFIRTIPKEHAFRLLRALPADQTVKVAREAFPGAWAEILNFKASGVEALAEISPKDLQDILQKANHLKGPLNISDAEIARKQRELMGYLRVASLHEEREIYMAAGQGSPITASRPAFFKVLESDPESLSKWAGGIPLDRWATALCNLSRSERDNIFKSFTEKQAGLLREMIRRFETAQTDANRIGDCREEIARAYANFENVPAPESSSPTEGSNAA